MPKPNVLIKRVWLLLVIAGLLVFLNLAYAQQEQGGQTSYMKVDSTEPFAAFMARMAAAKPGIAKEHNALLSERYDLSDRPAKGVAMDRGKPLQEGVRVKLPAGMTWERLAAMSADQIREQNLYPKGFYPLPHPKHTDGGFVFPRFLIDAIKQQDGRDLTRFDIDFDLPDHFLAEFPPAMYLTPRPDLGDVSQGKLVSLTNYYELFNGLLTPRQLEGLRLLLTPFPQQQFNATEDRRSAIPSIGSACFDCHSNGHQNGATHLAPDTRPQQFRHRIKTLSLRGVDIQRLFGSQRALKTIEDFTEFEQRRYCDRREEGREPPRARKPGRLHGRFSRDAGLPTGAQARCSWQAYSQQGNGRRDARPGDLLRQGPMRELPPAAFLHRQPDAQPPDGTLLQAGND